MGVGVLLMEHPLPDGIWDVPLFVDVSTLFQQSRVPRDWALMDGMLTEIIHCISVAEQVQWRERRKTPALNSARSGKGSDLQRYLIPSEIRQ